MSDENKSLNLVMKVDIVDVSIEEEKGAILNKEEMSQSSTILYSP
jgi:hypothetical protein